MIIKARIYTPLQTTFLDYPDPISQAVLVYYLGCDNMCEFCHNPLFRDYNLKDKNVKEYEINSFIKDILIFSQRNKTNKVCLEGGDPLSSENIKFTKEFLDHVKDKLDVCIYTGHSIDHVKDIDIKGFKFIKTEGYMKTVEQLSQKTDDYIQFASQNQKLFDSSYNLLSSSGRYYFNREK
jgi:organic radical activating enzyme